MDTSTKTSISARAKINNALRDGKLKKPSACEGCGTKTSDIEAHHFKGDKDPESVRWLCTTCHGSAHAGRDKHLSDSPINRAKKLMRQAAKKAFAKGEHETETM